MSGVMRQSFDGTSNSPEMELLGGTDQTKIGNVGDRLKVDASVSSVTGSYFNWNSKLRYINMTAIARQASITAASGWNTAFTYTGSGKIASFILNLEGTADWAVRLIVDSEEVFGSSGLLLTDVTSDAIYDMDDSGKGSDEGLGVSHGIFSGAHDGFNWKSPLDCPLAYSSSVTIMVSRVTGSATKKFRAGFIIFSKDT